jgi:fatty-acyl-CoA synthase
MVMGAPMGLLASTIMAAKKTRRKNVTKPGKPYEIGLDRVAANHQPLTPLSFLERAAQVFPAHTAIIHGKQRIDYASFYARSRRLASALAKAGIRKGDTVAVMLANTPPMLEAHYGVPMLGAVLNALNTRLDAAAIAFMLAHGEAKILITDREFSATVSDSLALLKKKPLVIDYDDREFPQGGARLGKIDYEKFLKSGDPDFAWAMPDDEWDAIALNYTSGTTGNPKGVVYHHRGAALMCYGNALAGTMVDHPVLLWTLPMFHCNGWCMPWSLSAVAGTHVCLRWVRAGAIFDALAEHGVTHLCGAPIVMSTLVNASEAERKSFPQKVRFMAAAAPPPESILAAMAEAGFEVVHVYGLTEVYGPAVVNEWHEEWNVLDAPGRAARKARQGVRYAPLEALAVLDPKSLKPVPADGKTIGEVMFRGNIVMRGYLKNPKATRDALKGGWFHSGDLGVMYPDGYIQLKDRSKDIIISGGENISSIEVEDAIAGHPAVLFVAVVARPDAKWGESPCAFVEVRPGHAISETDILVFAKTRLARFKMPRTVIFTELPKTSTGKIQKFVLRERAKALT